METQAIALAIQMMEVYYSDQLSRPDSKCDVSNEEQILLTALLRGALICYNQ